MGRVAFVIPFAPRHFHFAAGLGNLCTELSDVYAILSRERDRPAFEAARGNVPVRVVVLCPHYMSGKCMRQTETKQSVVTMKKWVGMAAVLGLGQYDFLIACDSELRVLRRIDSEFVAALPSQFTFVGGHPSTEDLGRYTRAVTEASHSFLTQQTSIAERRAPACHGPLYTWWSGLPVYDCATLPDFLREVGVKDPLALSRRLNPFVFDHIVYQKWMLTRNADVRLLCLQHDCGVPHPHSLETFINMPATYLAARRAAEAAGLRTLWVGCTREAEGVWLKYHADRF